MPHSYQHIKIPSFDELKALAEKSPEQFEALRHQLSMEFIDSLPEDRQALVFLLKKKRLPYFLEALWFHIPHVDS